MDKIFTIGLALTAIDNMSKVINAACGQAIQKFTDLQSKIKETSKKLAEIGTISYFAGSQIINTMKKPIEAFMELEDASTQLRSTLMEASGEVPKVFEKIDSVAKKLGAELPGTTSDFYRMASAMKALGVSGETIAGGALETAAYLGAVLKPLGVTYEQAAEYTVKFAEALGIAEKDLIKFMDSVQRLAHMGVNVEQMKYAFTKVSGVLKGLGIQGLKASEELAPLVGWLIKTGYGGEITGTALGNIITQLMDFKKVEKANQFLRDIGIQLEFVDRQTGKFKGIENMISELGKLKELPDVAKLKIFEALFGSGEDAKIAMTLATGGIEKYRQMQQQMAKQASLQQRVNATLGTFRNMWEAFTGTMQNLLATIGEAAAPLLKWLANTLNDLTDIIDSFAKKHQFLTKLFSIGALVVGGALISFGALGIALSVIMRVSMSAAGGIAKFISFIKLAIPWVRLKTLELWRLIGAKKAMDFVSYHGGFWKTFQFWLYTTKLRLLAFAGTTSVLKALVKSLGVALRFVFLTPVGLKIALLAAVAMAVYYHWSKLKAFFQGFWEGLKAGFAAVLEPLKEFWKAIKGAFEPLKPAIQFFKGLLSPAKETEKTLRGWAAAGRVVGGVIAFVITKPLWVLVGIIKFVVSAVQWVTRAFQGFVRFVSGINLFEAGKRLIETLWHGMKAVAMKPVEVVKDIAKKIRNLLPFSPAKEGPLAMLHKVNIIGTIAEGIKPQPLLSAMQNALRVITTAIKPALPIMPPMPVSAPALARTAMGMLSVNISQNIHFTGNVDADSAKSVAAQVATMTKEAVFKAIDEYFRRQQKNKAVWG